MRTVTIDVVNDQFMAWTANRYSDYTDDGNTSHLMNYYYYITYNTNKGSSTPSVIDTYKSISYDQSNSTITLDMINSSVQYDNSAMLPGTFHQRTQK